MTVTPVFTVIVMKRSDVHSDSAAGMPTGSVAPSDAAVAVPAAPAAGPVGPLPPSATPVGPVSLPVEPVEPVEPVSLPVEPVEPVSLPVEPVGPVSLPVGPVGPVEGVLSVLSGARDMVARASRVPLGDADCETLSDVVAVASRLRSATDVLLLAATGALEAARPGSGRAALVERARVSKRYAKRTVEVSEQVAQMPNVARGLAAGELNVEHAQVLADAARGTSPDAVDTAAELLEAAAVVSPETLRDQAKAFAALHDPAAAECELGRQRRERCTSLFVDESTGMGVLHAEFDPISFAFVRQALENYNDALWRLDGGRDGTPNQIRDNRQRLADSLFEMITDRNALVTIDHLAAHTPNPRDDVGGGSGRGSESDVAAEGPAGRSIDRWRPVQAPNQLIVIAEIGVIDGTKPDGTCELLGAGPVPPSILDNLSPDTRIAGALFDANGEILWLGCSRRHASVAQQLAVAIRDRGCVLCRAPMHHCRNHHIDEWAADNGNTDVPNLAALCNDCHNKLHNSNERLGRRPGPRRWATAPRTTATGDTSDTTATGPRRAGRPGRRRARSSQTRDTTAKGPP